IFRLDGYRHVLHDALAALRPGFPAPRVLPLLLVFSRADFSADRSGGGAPCSRNGKELTSMIATFPASKTPRLALVFLIGLLTTLASCQKSKTNSTTALAKRPKIDPCGLISAEEVQAIQGSPMKDVKGSEQSDGSFRIAQCFYNAETFNKSVSLAVTQSDPASAKARNPKDFWKDTFGRYEGEAKEEKGDEEKKKSLREQESEENATPPKKLDGIGDSAYWTANRMGGALYVLKNDVFIRVSVGGPESEDAKINRCKALAEKALSRL